MSPSVSWVGGVAEFDLDLRSGRVHAQRFGDPDARLVVGLHGLSGNMRHLDFIGERVAGGTYQVVAVDLRGRGRSEVTPTGTYGWERHALDVMEIAAALGKDRFSLIGQSMGGSVAIKVAELAGERLDAVVLVDVAGRVDRGVGAVIADVIVGLARDFDSVDAYVAATRTRGLTEPWNQYWDQACRYDAVEVAGWVRSRANPEAVAEDRAYTATQHPYERWKYLTMPTLLVRATRELRPGSGLVVPDGDDERFLRQVPAGTVAQVDANHLTVNTHPDTAAAIRGFLADHNVSSTAAE